MSITKEGLFKYQALNERQRKNLVILEAIRKSGPVSKTSLSKQVGYNLVTLSNYVEEYIKESLVREDGMDESSGGRKPQLIELNKNQTYLIGIDFSRDALRGVLTDLVLHAVSEVTVPRPPIEQEEVEKSIILLIKELVKNSRVDMAKIKFAGVGVYGAIGEKNGTIKGLDEEKGRSRATLYFTQLKSAVEKELGIKVFFGSDASFAAFGEKTKNPNADTDSMLYIFQDIGKGVVIKGEIYCSTDLRGSDFEGVTGSLSEEERTQIRDETAYLKPWNSNMSLRNEALKVIEKGVGTRIVEFVNGNLGALNDDVIIKASKEKDDIAVELIESVGINLGVRIAYLINLFSPKVIIVGGGIEKSGEILFSQIEKTIERLALEKPRNAAKILPSVLGEKAVAIGAAAVGSREVFLEA